MNDEYISRETALKKLQMQLLDLEADQDKGEYSELCENRGARDALDGAIYDIRTIKAADVQPVKRGRWFHLTDESIVYCSECNSEAYWDTDYGQQLFDYCPYCGAKMTKDGDTECK